MKIRITVQFELADEDGNPVENKETCAAVAQTTVKVIQERLFGTSSYSIDAYDIHAEIVL